MHECPSCYETVPPASGNKNCTYLLPNIKPKNVNTFRLLFLITVIGTVSSCTKTETIYQPPATDTQIQEKLQTMADKVLTDYKLKCPGYPGGLALKVISKKGSFFVSTGMGAGITSGIHFRAASNTKLFTSASILLLAQQGKLHVDAKISDTIPGTQMTYVPNTAEYQIPYRNQITIRQLLQHRAGIFDVSNDNIPDTITVTVPYKGKNYVGYVQENGPTHTFSFDELVGVVATCRLFYFQPGVSYHYSNTGYSILGKIIERISGQNYPQFVFEHIVQPMGLTNTSLPYTGTDREIPPPFVKGYIYTPDTLADVSISNISANVAEGNVITTPDDLSKFLRTLIQGNGVLLPYWVNQVLLAPPAGSTPGGWYGCGIGYALNLGYGHSGAHEGYLSRMVTDPELDFTAVVFTNGWDLSKGMASIADQLYFQLDEACYRAKVIVQ
jgi:D-alanyl-D-alanine carboxypeptidase